MKDPLSRHAVLLLLQNSYFFSKHVRTWRTITTHAKVDLAVWSLNTWGFPSERWQYCSTLGEWQKRQALTGNEFQDLWKYFNCCWYIYVREMGIFVLQLIYIWALESRTQHNCCQETSSYSVEIFDVHGGEQHWATIASMASLARPACCLSVSGLRQLLDKQFVLSLRALPCHVSTWTKTLRKNSYWTCVNGKTMEL